MNLINEGIQATQNFEPEQERQSQITQTGFFANEATINEKETKSLIGLPKSEFSNAILQIDPLIVTKVSQSLQITSTSGLVDFANKLNDSEYQLLLRLLSPFNSDTNSFSLPTSLTPDQIAFFDFNFRFQCSDFNSSIISGPHFVGNSPKHFTQTFSITSLQPNQRIIVQSISSTGISFPQSLIMWYGESLIYSPHFTTNRSYIYITSILNLKSFQPIEFTVQHESQWYCIVIRSITKHSYSQLINDTLKRRLPSQDTCSHSSICCPLTGKVMKIPARSLKCQHIQCFDLKSAIKRTPPDKPFLCPVCGENMIFSDVAVDYDLLNFIANQRVGAAYTNMVTNTQKSPS